MSVSHAGPLPSSLPGKRSTLENRASNHRGITDCLFCDEAFCNTASVLRHIKRRHRPDEIANSIDGWEVVDAEAGLFGMISERKNAKFRLGYCWECHHWIPGTTLVQLMAHECKERKPYVRKAAAEAAAAAAPVTPPAPAPKDPDDSDASAEEKDDDEEQWSDVRDILQSTLRKHTAKWSHEDRTRVMAVVHKAVGESDSMMGCMDLVRTLADLTRPVTAPAPAAPVAPPPAAPVIAMRPVLPPPPPAKKVLTTVGFTL